MTKPVTGQYEYLHRSGVGLDYFTSRIDRLTLQANGRFVLIVQDGSRIANAAKSFMNGQQAAINASETRREGSYTVQGNVIAFRFDDGGQEQGQVSWNDAGMQFGPNFFNKVSDSTLLPSPQRLKKDMDDIAKGLKIASTIGSIAIKAAKTIHDTIQATQEPGIGPAPSSPAGQGPAASAPAQPPQAVQSTPPPVAPAQAAQPVYSQPPVQQHTASSPQYGSEALFCDQCGARARPGKRFCNQCGAELP